MASAITRAADLPVTGRRAILVTMFASNRAGALSAAVAFGLLAPSGCRGEAAPAAARPPARTVDLDQLAAAVQQNQGRGTLVNVWATW